MLDWLYIIVALALLAIFVAVQLRLVFRALPNRFWRGFLLGWAVLILIGTIWLSRTPSDYISGIFIVIVLVLFGLRQQGFTKTWIIGGATSTRAFTGVSEFVIYPTKDSAVQYVEVKAGDFITNRFYFRTSQDQLTQFLQKQAAGRKVVVSKVVK
ncbi:hypothetical protein IV38_GL001933 [Lactobacillus selangorensis]|uniref:DUF5673 domain-containing protein n=1 Tax=Lactobacillus selangorensis TaxID=81857 RepID=A0A0R2FRR0_9LACO|nr:hypothetical protein [Lactobacillus selangorensis]KRN27720.1 hypothetical protein IV38_GL001933 [Lactobacillus selangorensis]KRN30315.1 hypothetical protein IV40_GL001904 [Lactobacillus selangorensis]